MRARICGVLLPLALILGCAAWAADEAGDVAGTWQIQWQSRQGSQQGTLTIRQNGDQFTGTMQGPRGSAPLSGTMKGNAITMNVEMQGEQRSFRLAFTGTVDGDKMSGTFQPQGGHRGHGGGQGENGETSRTWNATRRTGNSQPDQPSNPN
ncbi:MAG TPA: hypothetical protein VKB77_13610 [Terriglobales bacterium]|nr:hypothetical protein [Terriglobales bacterium]